MGRSLWFGILLTSYYNLGPGYCLLIVFPYSECVCAVLAPSWHPPVVGCWVFSDKLSMVRFYHREGSSILGFVTELPSGPDIKTRGTAHDCFSENNIISFNPCASPSGLICRHFHSINLTVTDLYTIVCEFSWECNFPCILLNYFCPRMLKCWVFSESSVGLELQQSSG